MHAGGIEIRPSFLAAVGAERRDVGAIILGARCRRAGIDLRRQTRENDKTRGGDRGDSDSGSGLDHGTHRLFATGSNLSEYAHGRSCLELVVFMRGAATFPCCKSQIGCLATSF